MPYLQAAQTPYSRSRLTGTSPCVVTCRRWRPRPISFPPHRPQRGRSSGGCSVNRAAGLLAAASDTLCARSGFNSASIA